MMTYRPVVISPKKTLKDAAKLMKREHVGALLVQDDGKLVGIITEQGIARKGMLKPGNPNTRKIFLLWKKVLFLFLLARMFLKL